MEYRQLWTNSKFHTEMQNRSVLAPQHFWNLFIINAFKKVPGNPFYSLQTVAAYTNNIKYSDLLKQDFAEFLWETLQTDLSSVNLSSAQLMEFASALPRMQYFLWAELVWRRLFCDSQFFQSVDLLADSGRKGIQCHLIEELPSFNTFYEKVKRLFNNLTELKDANYLNTFYYQMQKLGGSISNGKMVVYAMDRVCDEYN